MDMFGDPAALGGIILCAAMAGWTLGWWQGGGAPGRSRTEGMAHLRSLRTPQPGQPTGAGKDRHAVSPNQRAAMAEHRVDNIYSSGSLGALHAEVSAYRRAEQVLAGMDREEMNHFQAPEATGSSRGDPERGEKLTRAPSDTPRRDCACSAGQPEAASNPVQPSSAAFDLTRV